MNNKKLFILLLVVVLIQWFVPVKMILDQEDVLTDGQLFEFKIIPIDPNDPFRGKYIILNLEEDNVLVDDPENWVSGENIYVYLAENEAGLAFPVGIAKEQPKDNDYIKAKINYVIDERPGMVYIEYPFDRYYMEETKAPRAERILTYDSILSTVKVRVLHGESVIESVQIDGMKIEEWMVRNPDEEMPME